jgi:nucleoside-diphosphate kinase
VGGPAVEKTLFIVKPDAVERSLIGRIVGAIEEGGLAIVALRMTLLTRQSAGEFYRVHKGKEFYGKLVEYMTSGRIVAGVAEGSDAIRRLRGICGATDPASAAPGTVRATYGVTLTKNSIHASDAPATAREEVKFFFPDLE